MAQPKETSTYRLISPDQIVASPFQARKEFDEESLKELAASMDHEGLIQPITVRPLASGAYELISGERRVRAAKILKWQVIEARVIETLSDGEAAAKGLVENLQREDLNPIEEAEGFAELQKVDPKYWSQAKIAEVTGRTQGYISQSLRILALPHEILENIRRLIISRSHALELARLPSAEMQLEVAGRIPDHLTWKETRDAVTAILSGKSGKKPKVIKDSLGEDPLKTLWPSLLQDPNLAAPGTWGVNYGAQGRPGWSFWVGVMGSDPKKDLAYWFRRMADRLEGGRERGELSGQRPTLKPKVYQIEKKDLSGDLKNLRIPKTEGDVRQLEDLALEGPGAVYAWIYGQDSVMADQMKGTRWADLGVSDPIEGVRKIVDSLRAL